MKEHTEISMQLYQMMVDRGYSENLCDLVTRNLNTDYTATRMIGYLSHYSYLPEVEVVDEMLAILSDRGVSSSVQSVAAPTVILPIIKDIPFIGRVLSGQNILTWIALICCTD